MVLIIFKCWGFFCQNKLWLMAEKHVCTEWCRFVAASAKLSYNSRYDFSKTMKGISTMTYFNENIIFRMAVSNEKMISMGTSYNIFYSQFGVVYIGRTIIKAMQLSDLHYLIRFFQEHYLKHALLLPS